MRILRSTLVVLLSVAATLHAQPAGAPVRSPASTKSNASAPGAVPTLRAGRGVSASLAVGVTRDRP